MFFTRFVFGLAAALLSTSTLGAVCGPGLDWLKTCPAGVDSFTTTLSFGIDLNSDSIADENATFTGISVISRGSPTTNSFGITSLRWTLTSMQLVGNDGTLNGARLLGGTDFGFAPRLSSRITENDPYSSNAYLDYEFRIDGTPFGDVKLQAGKRLWVEADIDRMPPDEVDLRHTGCCFGTYIDALNNNGNVVFQIVDLKNTQGGSLNERPGLLLQPVPLPPSLYFLASGLVLLICHRRRPS